jgi:hypothetical protein
LVVVVMVVVVAAAVMVVVVVVRFARSMSVVIHTKTCVVSTFARR